VRHGGQVGGIGDQAVQEAVVPLGIDQAGARALQLVAHAARAPDLHLQRAVIAFHRAADGLAQLEAALARGHGVLHHVDVEGDDLAGPVLGLAEHQ